MRAIKLALVLSAIAALAGCVNIPAPAGGRTAFAVTGGNNGSGSHAGVGHQPGNQCGCSSSPSGGEHSQTGTSTGNSYGGTSPSTTAHGGATNGGAQTGMSGGFGPKSS